MSIPRRAQEMTKLGLCPGSRLATWYGGLGQDLVDNGDPEKPKGRSTKNYIFFFNGHTA